MIKIIHILGASEAGTFTLGKALEQKHGFKWLDTNHEEFIEGGKAVGEVGI